MNKKSLKDTEEFFTSYLEKMGMAWSVEIITVQPKCIYYFGPFASSYEAQLCSGGYIEDLEQEGAQEFAIDIKRGQPRELTIFEDESGESFQNNLEPVAENFEFGASSFTEAWLR